MAENYPARALATPTSARRSIAARRYGARFAGVGEVHRSRAGARYAKTAAAVSRVGGFLPRRLAGGSVRRGYLARRLAARRLPAGPGRLAPRKSMRTVVVTTTAGVKRRVSKLNPGLNG
jgi:hypothetical protein